MAVTNPGAAPRNIRLERFYDAPVEALWELWTTKPGFESWWGPAGFATEVTEIEVRAGGRIVYVMTAVDPEIAEFVRRQGTPVATTQVLTIAEAIPYRRLVTSNVVDFIPGVPAYETGMVVEMEGTDTGSRLVVTIEVMHDPSWTEMAVKGWESQLEKLRQRLAP